MSFPWLHETFSIFLMMSNRRNLSISLLRAQGPAQVRAANAPVQRRKWALVRLWFGLDFNGNQSLRLMLQYRTYDIETAFWIHSHIASPVRSVECWQMAGISCCDILFPVNHVGGASRCTWQAEISFDPGSRKAPNLSSAPTTGSRWTRCTVELYNHASNCLKSTFMQLLSKALT
jgi:hypothetical protein